MDHYNNTMKSECAQSITDSNRTWCPIASGSFGYCESEGSKACQIAYNTAKKTEKFSKIIIDTACW